MNELQMKAAAREQLSRKQADLVAKLAAGTATVEEKTTIKANNTALAALDVEIKDLKELQDIAVQFEKDRIAAEQVNPADRPANFGGGDIETRSADQPADIMKAQLPVSVRGMVPQTLSLVTRSREEAQKVAYSFGMWLTSFCNKDVAVKERADKWCKANGIVVTRAQAENNNSAGGFLVPIQLANYLIELMELFGRARALMNKAEMTGDTLSVPRPAGLLNTYWITDNVTITASQMAFDMVTLTAKKLATFVYYSNELADDAMINIGDRIARQMAWQLSAQEDMAAFNGDGTSTYGGIVGLAKALALAFPSGGPGIIVGTTGSGGNWASYTLADFNATQGALPQYARRMAVPKWYMSQQFYYSVPVKLAAAAGGNRIDTIQAGASTVPMFLGSPVEFIQVMPTAAAISQIQAYYGSLELSSTFGNRRTPTIALSDQIGFQADQMAIRCISRLDINNHDVGGNNAATLAQNPAYDQTGATYYAGPIVGLKSASS